MLADEIREEIEKLYINMEDELLMNIAKKLASGKPMEIDKWDLETNGSIIGSGGVNEWQLERLKELGGLTEENAKIIAKYSGQTVEKVNEVFERAKEIGAEVDKDMLEMGIKAGILNEVNPVLEDTIVMKILNNAIKETLTTFNTQNNSLLASAGREYTQIVNKVSTQVLAGTKTTTKAMQEAVTELAQKGLTGFTARNGAKWTPEAYTSMVLRANTKNTINNIQEERMKATGGKYWIINQYAGARPKCSKDQGKVFSVDGSTEPVKDLYGNKIEVRPWSSSSYGQPDGILGINCGHSRHIFVPGITSYDYEPIDKQENDDLYKEKQQQRLYERTIRNKKREVSMLQETGAEKEYIKRKKDQLTNYRKEYLEFLDKTGRTRRSGSEWIGTTAMSDKQQEKAMKSYENWKKTKSNHIDYVETTNRWLKNAKPNSHTVQIMNNWEYNGKKYLADGKNVILDYSNSEKETAEWLENTFGGKIYMCPRVNNPIGVNTPDYLWKNEYWDLKKITGNGNRTIDSAIKKKKNQASNFIFDVSNSKLSNEDIKEQLEKIYSNKDRYWVNKLLIKRDNDVVVIYERNKKRD